MFLLTAIYSFLRGHGKAIAVTVAILLVFAVAYAAGWWHEHDKFVTYKATVAQAAADQAQRTDEIVKRHKAEKEAIHEDYQNRIKRLRAAYERRLRNTNSASTLPYAGNSTSRVDDPAADTRSLKRSALLERCALTTLQLEELQQWVRRTR